MKSEGAELDFLVSLVVFDKKRRGKDIPFCTKSAPGSAAPDINPLYVFNLD